MYVLKVHLSIQLEMSLYLPTIYHNKKIYNAYKNVINLPSKNEGNYMGLKFMIVF